MSRRTPVEEARNLGPITVAEFSTLGVVDLEQIKEVGWEDFCIKYVEFFPERLNLNAFYAIIGAIYDQDWREIDSDLKLQAQKLQKRLKGWVGR